MPNGEDRNWVHLVLTVEGFTRRHGCRPTRMRLDPGYIEEFANHLLRPDAWERLSSRIRLIPERDVHFIAEDEAGRSFPYSQYDYSSDPQDSYEWLSRMGISTADERPYKPPAAQERVLAVLADAKRLAREFYRLTSKPLGITGEVAEYEAARVLGIQLTPARQAGYDAIEEIQGRVRRLQIKGRYLPRGAKRSQQIGSIDITKEFDSVLLVLLDERYDAFEIYEADREAVMTALAAPGSRARNERNALSISKFKSIGRMRWKIPRQYASP
jgi:hypothetical protein